MIILAFIAGGLITGIMFCCVMLASKHEQNRELKNVILMMDENNGFELIGVHVIVTDEIPKREKLRKGKVYVVPSGRLEEVSEVSYFSL